MNDSDSRIEQCVLRELRLEDSVISKEFCVLCSDGTATLRGTLANESEKRAVLRAAARAVGVARVIDNLKVSELKWRTVSESRPALTGRLWSASAG